MKVKELIEILSRFNPELNVITLRPESKIDPKFELTTTVFFETAIKSVIDKNTRILITY